MGSKSFIFNDFAPHPEYRFRDRGPAATPTPAASRSRSEYRFRDRGPAATRDDRRVASAVIATAFAETRHRGRPSPVAYGAGQLRPKMAKRAAFMHGQGVKRSIRWIDRRPNEAGVRAYTNSPAAHRAKLHCSAPSNDSTAKSGAAPRSSALVGAILLERNDEWAVRRSHHTALETIAAIGDVAASPSAEHGSPTTPPPSARRWPAVSRTTSRDTICCEPRSGGLVVREISGEGVFGGPLLALIANTSDRDPFSPAPPRAPPVPGRRFARVGRRCPSFMSRGSNAVVPRRFPHPSKRRRPPWGGPCHPTISTA